MSGPRLVKDEIRKPLNAREEKFCRNMTVADNGTQSAIDAGYAAKSAHVTASRLLNKDKIRARIAELREANAVGADVTADRILNGMLEIAEDPETTDAARVAAFSWLGKYKALWTDKHVVEKPESFEVTTRSA